MRGTALVTAIGVLCCDGIWNMHQNSREILMLFPAAQSLWENEIRGPYQRLLDHYEFKATARNGIQCGEELYFYLK